MTFVAEIGMNPIASRGYFFGFCKLQNAERLLIQKAFKISRCSVTAKPDEDTTRTLRRTYTR